MSFCLTSGSDEGYKNLCGCKGTKNFRYMQDFGEIFIKFKEKCARACICAKKAVTLQRKRRMNHENTIFRRNARSNR